MDRKMGCLRVIQKEIERCQGWCFQEGFEQGSTRVIETRVDGDGE